MCFILSILFILFILSIPIVEQFTTEIRGIGALSSSAHGLHCLRKLIETAASDHRVVRVLVAPEYVMVAFGKLIVFGRNDVILICVALCCFVLFVFATFVVHIVRLRLMNDNARGITQSGTAGNEPLGTLGLTGANQVVGVADTGVDDLSCFFVDDSGTITPRSTASNPQTYPERRKVIQYVAYADNRDEENGHGTHVCGSVLGQSTILLFTLLSLLTHDKLGSWQV